MTENGKSLLFSSTMDFSSLFPVSLLSTPGLHTFKINQLSISQVDNGDEGAFCVADCYIILHAFHETSDDERESSIAHLIFTWIGLQAQLDKRFCAAIYAVGLKSLLVKPCRILRQTQGDETLDFLSLFPTLTYLEATAATESGLYPVQERHFPLLLYKIHGKFDFKLTLVEPNYTQLSASSVFILDYGHEIYQWNGSRSLLHHRLKARLICTRINTAERKGRARFLEMNAKEEISRFWDILGGEPEDDECQDLLESPDAEWRTPVLYGISGDQLNLKDPSTNIASGPDETLSRSLLYTSSAFILDAETQIFLWIGKAASPQTRGDATELLTKILPLLPRPRWLGLHKCMEDHEPEVFKMYFPDWEGSFDNAESENADLVDGLSKSTQIDTKALFTPPRAVTVDAKDLALVEETMAHFNSLLVNMTSFVFKDGKFKTVKMEGKSEFFLDDSYIFLCVYKTEDVAKESSETQQESSPQGSHLECIVYFWKGRKSRRAYSEFRFSMQQDLEELVSAQYSCPVKIIYVDPGKEPIMLLAHLTNASMYMLGNVSLDNDVSSNVIYHIRVEPRHGTIRAYEFLPKEIHFTSEDVFLIGNSDACSLWIGKDVKQFEDKLTQFISSHFPSLSWTTIHQDTLDSEKWMATLSSTFTIHPRGPFDIHLTASRLFRCCCSLGYFSIEEIVGFGQDDLREDTCCILEVQPLNKLFLWRGREASDVVLSLTLKSISFRWSTQSSADTVSKTQQSKAQDFEYFSDSDDRVMPIRSVGRKSLDDSKMKRHPTARAAKSKSVSDVSELMPKGPGGEGSFIFIDQGKEGLDFTCYFHGWNARLFEVVEPSNNFLESIGQKRASH